MRAVLTEDIFTDRPELKEQLRKGKVVKIHIAEHNKTDKEKNGWYLINTGVESTGIYISDPEVERGDIIRTYRDLNLPKAYNCGPYQWINKEQANIFHDTNESAKHLLTKYEWRL